MQDDNEQRLDELLVRWEQATKAGLSLSVEELCPDADTQLRAELTEAIDCLKRFCVFETFSQSPEQEASEFRTDQYEGVEEINAGGQGRVIRARDLRLGRHVAIKLVKDLWLASAKQRFEQEARITGSLEHPGVIPIYGFGHDREGKPYYAMRYVKQERTFKDLIEQTRAMPPGPEKAVAFQNLLRTFLTMCRTVEFAHSREIIHRDIKPENVLVGDFGEVFVTDWGIAKSLTGNLAATEKDSCGGIPVTGRTAGVLGTAAYMSPEQARDPAGAGKLSDVFSLGATLYHALTGESPRADGASLDSVKPRRIDPTIPPALEAVCLKALRRVPEERYPGAGDLAAEIERWLADEPTQAWPEPLIARTRRWMKRHRTTVTAGAAILLMGTLALAFMTLLLAQWNNERAGFVGELKKTNEQLEGSNQQLESVNAEMKKKNKELADSLYVNQFLAAYSAWAQMDIGRAEAILDQCDSTRRSFEWHYLKERCRGNRRVIASLEGAVRSLTVSNDAKTIAVTNDKGHLRMIEATSGRKLPGPTGVGDFVKPYQTGAFRPDGKQFVAVVRGDRPSDIGEYLARWDPATGDTLKPIPLGVVSSLKARILAYCDNGQKIVMVTSRASAKPNPDGKAFAAYSEAVLTTWDAFSGKRLDEIPLGLSAGDIYHGQFSPDGKMLALCGFGLLQIRHIHSGKVVSLKGVSGLDSAVAFRKDGKHVATAWPNGKVCLWNSADGMKLKEFTASHLAVRALAFTDHHLASAGEDRGIKVWDTNSGLEVTTLRGHADQINSLAVLDGRLVSGGNAGAVHVWRYDLSDSDLIHSGLLGRESVYDLAFSPDGNRLFSAHRHRTNADKVRIASLPEPSKVDWFPVSALRLALSSSGKTLAVSVPGRLEIWDVAQRRKLKEITGATHPIAFSPNGKFLAAVSTEEFALSDLPRKGGGVPEIDNELPPRERTLVIIIDVESGRANRRLKGERGISAVEWLADDQHLATYSLASMVMIWNTESGTLVRQFDTGQFDARRAGGGFRMRVSPDGQFLATIGNDSPPSVRVWNAATTQLLWESRAHVRPMTDLTFTPDSRRLATASTDKSVKLWDAATGQELLVLPAHQNSPFVLAFSPDNRRLACGYAFGRVHLWPSLPSR